jgi:hypothetical protein
MGPNQLGEAPYTATAASEEIFGPLVLVDVGDNAKQAVEIANRTQYGLTSSTLSGDTPRGFELAPKILRGSVNVNLADSDRRDPRADGRRARQRLGTDGFEMPRRFQRRHLDRGAATVMCLNNVRRDDTVLGSAAAYRLANLLRRFTITRWVSVASGATISKPWGRPGSTCSSVEIPAAINRRAYSMFSSRRTSRSPTSM